METIIVVLSFFIIFWILYSIASLFRKSRKSLNDINEFIKTSVIPNKKKTTSFSSKINILIEDMNYSQNLKEYIELKTDLNAEVFTWQSNSILKFLEIRNETDTNKKDKLKKELLTFDIISLPYFSLKEAVDEGYLTAFEDVTNKVDIDSKELAVFIDKYKNNQQKDSLAYNDKTYGIPFTEISVVLAYNQSRLGTIQPDLETLFENSDINFGVLDVAGANSHFYDFCNFLGYYGKHFAYNSENENELFDDSFSKALKLYLAFYTKSYKHEGSWASMLDELRLGTFNCCFLWTEQIPELEKYSYLKYESIKQKPSGYNQADGWYFGIVKKDFKKDILKILIKITEIDFQKEVNESTLSSPITSSYNNSELIQYLNKIRHSKKSRMTELNSEITQKLLRKSSHKPNDTHAGDVMRIFSNEVKALGTITDTATTTNTLIAKLKTEFKKIYPNVQK